MLPLKDPYLYSIIFGESVLNDAVGILMFDTFDGFSEREGGTGIKLLQASGVFLVVSVGSVALGVAIGLAGAAITRVWYVDPNGNCHFEISLIFFASYTAYLLGDFIGLSGILSQRGERLPLCPPLPCWYLCVPAARGAHGASRGTALTNGCALVVIGPGIISLFAATVITTHYTFYNVSPATLNATNGAAPTLRFGHCGL